MKRENKPYIIITTGDPAGIGPEVTLKALNTTSVRKVCKPLVMGNVSLLEETRKSLKIKSRISLHPIKRPDEAVFGSGTINVLDIVPRQRGRIRPGIISREGGRLSVRYVEKAIEMAMQQEADAVVTASLCKEAINMAGYRYQGHTEIFAEKTGVKNFAMMLATDSLKVIHVSLHLSLSDSLKMVKKARILNTISLGNQVLRDLGIKNPRIIVTGLNPHAGEGGLFGKEEIKEIIPAVKTARKKGFNVDGPFSPDVVFHKAIKEKYDLVVAMYHDQGHIAIKTTSFDEGVNITAGLPIIRTSVGHGTAFDIAGKDCARPDSLLHAIRLASIMAKNRKER
jgi:4-phospho-D-threonate 3-dehydrogenase / 4-phospho-D-erythronate 3-dehydrogenase